MTLTPAELDALIARIADAVADRLASRPRLLDRHELARSLGISVPTIERLQADGRIVPIRIGRRTQYDVEAVVRSLSGPVAGGTCTTDSREPYRVIDAAGSVEPPAA